MINLNTLTLENADTSNLLENVFVDESYFLTTLKYVTECKNDMRDASKQLYVSIVENGENHEIINESFSDFFSKIRDIIKKFLNYIKSLFDRFILSLNKFVNSDKYLNKHKDKLKNFESRHEFDFKGYEFTFDENVPSIKALAEFDKDFVGFDFDELKAKKDATEIQNFINDKYAGLKTSLNNNYYDIIRAEVLGQDNKTITQSDFAQELFMAYRNQCESKDAFTVDNTVIIRSLGFFENYKNIEKSVKKTKDEIDRDYKEIEKKVKNMVYRNKDKDAGRLLNITDNNGASVNINAESMSKIDLYLQAKCTQIVEMSNIHAMAFSYKLDALLECYKQDKQILYMALQKIAKNTKEA